MSLEKHGSYEVTKSDVISIMNVKMLIVHCQLRHNMTHIICICGKSTMEGCILNRVVCIYCKYFN